MSITADLVVLTLNRSQGVFNRHAVRKRFVEHPPYETKELFEEVRNLGSRCGRRVSNLICRSLGVACFSFCEDA
jgi:hypothetical protein